LDSPKSPRIVVVDFSREDRG